MSISIVDSDAWDNIEKVADLVTKGLTPYQIARRLNIKVIEAKAAITQWHEMLARDMDAKDAARDYLNQMVAHYDFLIAAARENLERLETLVYDEKISAQINATIKTIGDLEKTRAAMLKEAGLLDVGELGDELAEREEREKFILDILQNDLCEACKIAVRDKITKLTGEVHGTVIDGEVEDE